MIRYGRFLPGWAVFGTRVRVPGTLARFLDLLQRGGLKSMTRLIKMLSLAATAMLFGLCFATPASAQATRTWISGVGDDVNPCSRTAPCKTFAGAISKTAPGGEIDVLDPGGFGAVTITKSITLDGGGGIVGSILFSGVNGVLI